MRREAIGGVVDRRTQELIEALLAYGGAPTQRPPAFQDDGMPLIPLGFAKDGVVLRYFSMVCTVGTPTAVTTQELRVECMFPADEDTERRHADLMASSAKAGRQG